MTSRDFAYWLNGFFEIQHNGPYPAEPQLRYNLNDDQIDTIRNHLAMVFKHEIDPSHGDKKHQEALSEIHQGTEERVTKTSMADLARDSTYHDMKFNC